MKNERIEQFQEMKRSEIQQIDMPGIKIAALELTTSNDPVAITFEADDGRVLKITGYSTYETRIRIFTNKPPESVTKYQLTGELGPDVFHDETFDKIEDAERRMAKLDNDYPNSKDLKINEITVEV